MFFYLSNDTENQLFYTIVSEDVNKYRYFDTNNAHAPPSPFLNVCTGGGGGGTPEYHLESGSAVRAALLCRRRRRRFSICPPLLPLPDWFISETCAAMYTSISAKRFAVTLIFEMILSSAAQERLYFLSLSWRIKLR
jgi:hypothetical protein